MPDRHTLFRVIAGTVIGMPALTAAWRGDLARARLQHLTHEHVVDLLGADAGALERALDGDAAEVHRAQSGERAGELADGRAGRSDDHRTGHGGLLDSGSTERGPNALR